MKYLSSILFAITLLFSCAADTDKDHTKASDTVKGKPAASTNSPAVRPIIVSDTYEGQLVSLSRIYLKYSANGPAKTDEVIAELAKITHKDLTFVKSFIFELTQKSDKLLTKKFLPKPSKEDLVAIYKVRFINWNSMSLEPVTEKVLDKMELSKMTDTETLTNYYSLLASALATNRNELDTYSKTNIDLNSLGLANEKEKGIVFYCLASRLASKYNVYSRGKSEKCNETKKLSFATFNGKKLFEAKPPVFEDFNFIRSNNMPNYSFKKAHESAYNKAKVHYMSCK